jgi:hypothetical protein
MCSLINIFSFFLSFFLISMALAIISNYKCIAGHAVDWTCFTNWLIVPERHFYASVFASCGLYLRCGVSSQSQCLLLLTDPVPIHLRLAQQDFFFCSPLSYFISHIHLSHNLFHIDPYCLRSTSSSPSRFSTERYPWVTRCYGNLWWG